MSTHFPQRKMSLPSSSTIAPPLLSTVGAGGSCITCTRGYQCVPFKGTANPRIDPNTITTCGFAISSASVNTTLTVPVTLLVLSAAARTFSAMGNRPTVRRRDILRDLEGLVKVGEMLVVLGRPGWWWLPTLLKSIAGETHGFYVEEDAHINYQGILLETMHKDFRGAVIYNAQTDVPFPDLTVGQTLPLLPALVHLAPLFLGSCAICFPTTCATLS
ncbi:hypothetical protein BDZ89DRAFT_1134814 [Hymenopellis radicata]|nr:hypothetical protein BDZ89DRAFT_1134814 [Hymenopellis radicata]